MQTTPKISVATMKKFEEIPTVYFCCASMREAIRTRCEMKLRLLVDVSQVLIGQAKCEFCGFLHKSRLFSVADGSGSCVEVDVCDIDEGMVPRSCL